MTFPWGQTTKIHAVVDAEGRPIALDLTAAQTHDSQISLPLLGAMREGTIVLADKAYDTNALRSAANEKNAWANIPNQEGPYGKLRFQQLGLSTMKPSRIFFNKIKQFRGIATRYDKNPLNFLAAIKIIAARIWIKTL